MMVYLNSELSRAWGAFTDSGFAIATNLKEVAFKVLEIISSFLGLHSVSLRFRQISPVKTPPLKLEKKALEIVHRMNSLCEESPYVDLILRSLAESKQPPSEFQSQDTKVGEQNFEFLSFLISLVDSDRGEKIHDHYENILSEAATKRLRSMVFEIMNRLFDLKEKKEDDFDQILQCVVCRINLSLKNCSNRIITEIENTFYDLCAPKEGALGVRVHLFLQQYRKELFHRSIQEVIRKKDPSLLEHDASSFSYYLWKIGNKVGVPFSAAMLDENHSYRRYALKDCDQEVMNCFFTHYSAEKIVDRIYDTINNPEDPAISTKLFNDWVIDRYQTEDRCLLLDENGCYKKSVTLALLQELEVVSL